MELTARSPRIFPLFDQRIPQPQAHQAFQIKNAGSRPGANVNPLCAWVFPRHCVIRYNMATEAQIRRIYAETIDALYAYVSRRCGGVREVAEDVTQETWLRAVRTWARDGIPDTPLAWLKTVARNYLLNDLRRREAVSLDHVSADVVLSAIEHDDASDSADVAALMTQALARLPAHDAGLLEEFHFERFKVAQLAEKYGISERAIEGRLRRARERLRGELEITLKEHGGIP